MLNFQILIFKILNLTFEIYISNIKMWNLSFWYINFLNFGHESQDVIHPYIIKDNHYLFLPWLMILHEQSVNIKHTFLEVLYNRHFPQRKVNWKMFLGYWKRLANNYYSKAIIISFSFWMLLHVAACYLIWYQMGRMFM